MSKKYKILLVIFSVILFWLSGFPKYKLELSNFRYVAEHSVPDGCNVILVLEDVNMTLTNGRQITYHDGSKVTTVIGPDGQYYVSLYSGEIHSEEPFEPGTFEDITEVELVRISKVNHDNFEQSQIDYENYLRTLPLWFIYYPRGCTPILAAILTCIYDLCMVGAYVKMNDEKKYKVVFIVTTTVLMALFGFGLYLAY